MTDVTRATVWSILSEGFGAILRTLHARIPNARMTAGHSHNEAFLFRAYAEYSIGDQVVDLSFDVQVKDPQLHIFGDIARGDGLIVKILMETESGPEPSDEAFLVTHAKEFALRCKENAGLIANELALVGRKPRH